MGGDGVGVVRKNLCRAIHLNALLLSSQQRNPDCRQCHGSVKSTRNSLLHNRKPLPNCNQHFKTSIGDKKISISNNDDEDDGTWVVSRAM